MLSYEYIVLLYPIGRCPNYFYLGTLFLTQVKLKPSMNKRSYAQLRLGWNYPPIPKLQRLLSWSLELLNTFIPHFMVDVITYPRWD